MSKVRTDFDRLALLDSGGWTHNNHYHDFLLQHVPSGCANVLEVGCGTGAFSRRLTERAQQVLALDLSPEMIRVARANSTQFPQIQFEVADVMAQEFTAAYYDCIATIATLHHVPQREALLKLREALRPGGTMIVMDLFEPNRKILSWSGLVEGVSSVTAMAMSSTLKLVHNGRLRPSPEVRAAWAEHGKTDSHLTMSDVHALYSEVFPGVTIRKHLLWRYSAIWIKPSDLD
jgi:2-polyprenyl-3-methyl-5-hydroxy-6-metoxy-1,4-benzoquinol methylase